ncbi:MAG: radical SAM protein [Halomonas sp.]|uniref:radical SAM protein n=1 Tax=Halomonas sp. TaxID=1486246 RepID=UPI003F926BF2
MPVGQTAIFNLLLADTRPPRHAAASAAYSDSLFTANLQASNLLARPLSVNISIPFCRHRCHHCMHTLLDGSSAHHLSQYLTRLDQHMAQLARQLDEAREVQQLHWSGGNPALLSLDQMSALVDYITAHLTLASDAGLDFSVDLDPRDASLLMLRHLQALGVNRINLSVVELDPEIQLRIGRIQPRHLLEPLIDEAQRLGMRSFGLDLWIGLPGQTEKRLTRTLHRLIELAPSGMRLFDFDYDPTRFPAQAALIPPSANNARRLHETARNVLNDAGYTAVTAELPHLRQPVPLCRIYAREGAALEDALELQRRRLACDQLGIEPDDGNLRTELTPGRT